ncbi:MAG: 50S ribosomal protein L9 [Gemmataceae bacterium]|nr:50S ribosomal protein L9 [Gemmataceae bacterium]MDW8264920.1 50S ribosomal protein L9 [Gemmataceae bacterium]
MPTKRRNQVRKGSHGGMQLVLTEDVPHLGKQGELVEVRPGYGRNYLLPNGLATIPTEHNLRLLERYKVRVAQAREAKIADLRVLAEQIQRVTLTIEANANEEGHLYGSVGPVDIAKALRAQNLPVDPDMVRMEGPIRECALYAVKLNLGYDIETEVKVLVVRQQDRK